MTTAVLSRGGASIRLTDERWAHIIEEHAELREWQAQVLEAVGQPLRVLLGGEGELLAVREVEAGKFLVVVYREMGNDGFIITSFLTRRLSYLDRRKQVWP